MATKENMKKWEDANKKLAEAHKKREAERGTSKTTNPLMKDFKERMEKRETEKAKEETKQLKKEARKAGRKFSTEKDKSQYVAPNGKEYGSWCMVLNRNVRLRKKDQRKPLSVVLQAVKR
jgi:hypothetical protein